MIKKSQHIARYKVVLHIQWGFEDMEELAEDTERWDLAKRGYRTDNILVVERMGKGIH